MLVVALTGGIASGKSVVAEVLRGRGCAVYSSDQIARGLMAPGRPAWKSIAARYGGRILNPDGTIDRARLGRIIFAGEDERRFVNSVVHPLVHAERRKLVARLEREGQVKIFVSEAALTIEAGLAGAFDKVIVVFCAPEIQRERLMARDGIGREEALSKIRSQMPGEEKLRSADYIIDTSGALEETIAQTERVYAKLLEDVEVKRRKKASPRIRRKAEGPQSPRP